MNVSGFLVSLSAQSLNFPAAQSPEQERWCLPRGTRCGLGPRQLSTPQKPPHQHVSCDLKTASSCFLATTLFRGMWSATGTPAWKHGRDRKHPQIYHVTSSPLHPHRLPSYSGCHLQGQSSQLGSPPKGSASTYRSPGSFQGQIHAGKSWFIPLGLWTKAQVPSVVLPPPTHNLSN